MALIDYNILSAKSTLTLVALVKAAAPDGWLPQGSAFFNPGSAEFCQTMVKGDVAGGGAGGGEGESYELPEASAEDLGGVLQGEAVADAADAEGLLDTVNGLLASLRDAGTIASE